MKNRFIVVVTVMVITTTMLVHLCQILSVLCYLQCRAEPTGFACDDPERECLNHRPEDSLRSVNLKREIRVEVDRDNFLQQKHNKEEWTTWIFRQAL